MRRFILAALAILLPAAAISKEIDTPTGRWECPDIAIAIYTDDAGDAFAQLPGGKNVACKKEIAW